MSYRTKRNGVFERKLVSTDFVWMLILFLCSFSLGIDALEPVNVKLEIENPCWFHKREDPVLVCTVESLDFWILWEKDWEFLVHDQHIIDDPGLSLNRTIRNNSREETLRFPFDDAVSLVTSESQFVCENQGCSSRIFTFGIPDCRECVSDFNQTTSILSDVNGPKVPIELDMEDPRWYDSGSEPVFVCTVSETEDNIHWQLGETPLEGFHSTNTCRCDKGLPYCTCTYPVQHKRATQGKLVLSLQSAQNLIEMKTEVTCATKTGQRSSPQVLMIQDQRECEKCSYNIGLPTGSSTESETSLPGTSSRRLMIAAGTFGGFLFCILVIILVVCGIYCRKHKERLMRPHPSPGTQVELGDQGTKLLQINHSDAVSTSNA